MRHPDPTPYPIDHVLRGRPDAPALVLRDRTLSFAQAERAVAGLAGWLRETVAQPGARVASWAAKGWLTSLLPLAAPRAGLVHVPINPLLKRAQVAHILADSAAALLIATPSRLATLADNDVPPECALVADDGVFAGPPLPRSAADTDAIAAILYTSGSTGRPKGVMLSHANLWLGAISVAHYLALAEDDAVLALLPYAFDYGQNQLLSTWAAGGRVVPIDYLLPRDVSRACALHRITTIAAVPPLWWQVLDADWPAEATRHIRRLTNSGGALTPALVGRLRETFPEARLFAMYGLTEAFRSTYLDPALIDAHPTSIGDAIPFAEVLVVRDDGAVAAAGEEGELVHAGPLIAKGYWRDPERTAARFRPAPPASRYGGTAVWSGDRVVRDARGLLHFAGRRDAMIKSAGHRISPQEVEDAALATGFAEEAVAIGIADARLGQAIGLAVRGDPVHGAALALKQALPGFMQPRRIRWFDRMPTGPNGKVDRTALAAELGA